MAPVCILAMNDISKDIPGSVRVTDVLLDARINLILGFLAIVAVFASSTFGQLSLLATFAFFLLRKVEVLNLFRQRLFWLRWFFIFIILLHTLLSPGYTLWGVSWLSLDGLMFGLKVSVQISIALAASLVLTHTASAEQLTAAAAHLFQPLSLLGINVKQFMSQILSTLRFVPILREETVAVAGGLPEEVAGVGKLKMLVVTLMGQLVERADQMALDAALTDQQQVEVETLGPFWPLNRSELKAVSVALFIFAIYCVLA